MFRRVDALPPFPPGNALHVGLMLPIGGCRADELVGGRGARYTYAERPPPVGESLDAPVGAAREQLLADAELILEPGRSMVASAAATLYRVVTVKRGGLTFVAVDGHTGDNLEWPGSRRVARPGPTRSRDVD